MSEQIDNINELMLDAALYCSDPCYECSADDLINKLCNAISQKDAALRQARDEATVADSLPLHEGATRGRLKRIEAICIRALASEPGHEGGDDHVGPDPGRRRWTTCHTTPPPNPKPRRKDMHESTGMETPPERHERQVREASEPRRDECVQIGNAETPEEVLSNHMVDPRRDVEAMATALRGVYFNPADKEGGYLADAEKLLDLFREPSEGREPDALLDVLAGALYRIAQGVEKPMEAAREVLERLHLHTPSNSPTMELDLPRLGVSLMNLADSLPGDTEGVERYLRHYGEMLRGRASDSPERAHCSYCGPDKKPTNFRCGHCGRQLIDWNVTKQGEQR